MNRVTPGIRDEPAGLKFCCIYFINLFHMHLEKQTKHLSPKPSRFWKGFVSKHHFNLVQRTWSSHVSTRELLELEQFSSHAHL